jgi:hypothetical protein
MDASPKPDDAREPAPAADALPSVESPPLSPASEAADAAASQPSRAEPPAREAVAATPAIESENAPAKPWAVVLPSWPRIVVRPRHKRELRLIASVILAGALGALAGVLASGHFSTATRPGAAVVAENQAMQRSIARLGKDIATLKAGLAQTNKSPQPPAAKMADRLDHAAGDITGTISAPQMLPPLPRPAPRLTAADSQPAARMPRVAGWTIRDSRNGYVYAERRGELYRVVLGAPLPGLGPVQSVTRQDGRWMVVTPLGVIVSMRDRRYFEDF